MLQVYGLESHIRSNKIKTGIVLVIFPFVLPGVIFALSIAVGVIGQAPLDQLFSAAGAYTANAALIIVPLMVLWVPIGYAMNQWIIDRATGAVDDAFHEERRVWHLMDALCQRGGLNTPKLRIIDAEEMNAYSSGVSERSYSVTVTRGLVDALDDDELEAVIGHELTHIKNRDVQLTVVTSIIAGVAPLACDLMIVFFRAIFWIGFLPFRNMPIPGSDIFKRVQDLAFMLCAGCIRAMAKLMSAILNMLVSRKREFMADAGAVELTGNGSAMISALKKISGKSDLPTSVDGVRQMYFDNSLAGLLSTHPPIESRIDALAPFVSSSPSPQRTSIRETKSKRRFEANYAGFLNDQIKRARPASKQERYDLYKLVSDALLKQLTTTQPPLTDNEWKAEQAAFHAAVQSIELA